MLFIIIMTLLTRNNIIIHCEWNFFVCYICWAEESQSNKDFVCFVIVFFLLNFMQTLTKNLKVNKCVCLKFIL